MSTNLNGLTMASSTAILLQSYLFLGGLTCLGETVRYFMLKLYWINSDMSTDVRNQEDTS